MKLRENKIIFIAALVMGFLQVGKTLYTKDCYPYDRVDDVNHAMVNLKSAQGALRDGELPLMNIFNNFGTPLVGDGITYPFALHSIPFYFLSGPKAFFVNRFLAALLSVWFVGVFLRRFMSPFAAAVTSSLVFLVPGFLTHSAHYHYQFTIFYFVLGLFAIDHFLKKKVRKAPCCFSSPLSSVS